MTHGPLKTVVIGFGKMATGYAEDPAMARYYPFATHSQVLARHAGFEWLAVVDPSSNARSQAKDVWNVPHVAATVPELGPVAGMIDVAVLATPPDARIELLESLPNLKAVLVEKPLGTSLAMARQFLESCRKRNILVQVNLWRRADESFRRLSGQLQAHVGRLQVAAFYYGNGLLNNGTHMVDFARMLFGEVRRIQRLAVHEPFEEGPIPGDDNVAFAMEFVSGGYATFAPLHFADYRENGVMVWGTSGRMDILNEGLVVSCYPHRQNRAMSGEREIAADASSPVSSTVGTALYAMFSNLADAVAGTADLHSPGDSALITSELIDLVRAAPVTGEAVIVSRAS